MQGTTPTLTLAIDPADFSVSDIVALELAVKQKNNVTLYSLADVTLDAEENTISYRFSEIETLTFTPGVWLTVQLRVAFADGNICGSDPMNFGVEDLISPEVLSP
jgi:hypothetical protein